MNKNKQNYFTQEIRDQILNMKESEMNEILKGLEGTPIFIAILKYSQERIGVLQNSFLTIDPVKDPTQMARYQGIITGVLDLQDAVLSLNFPEETKKDTSEIKNNGGAYGKGY